MQKEILFKRNMYRKDIERMCLKCFPVIWKKITQNLLEEENDCEEETNLTPQDTIGNIDCYKYECECKPMATFAESFSILLRLNSRSAKGASRPFSFHERLPDYESHVLHLSTKWMSYSFCSHCS